MSDAERDLRAAEDALRQALERGATDEEIKKLTDQLRQAWTSYLQALAEQMRRDGKTDAQPARPQRAHGAAAGSEEHARPHREPGAHRLARGRQAPARGIAGHARRTCARQDGPPRDQQDGDMTSSSTSSGRMIQEQQRLRDRTYRQGRESRASAAIAAGSGPKRPRATARSVSCAEGQDNLRQQLESMLGAACAASPQQQGEQGEHSGKDQGNEAGEALGRAEQAMRDAEGSLGEGEADGAVEGTGPRAAESAPRRPAHRRCDAGWPGDGPGEPDGQQARPPIAPIRSGARALARVWRRFHGQGARRDRRAARPPRARRTAHAVSANRDGRASSSTT